MKSRLTLILIFVLVLLMTACSREKTKPEDMKSTTEVAITEGEYETESDSMRLFINETEIPVIWEDNSAVRQLQTDVKNNDLVVDMSMYSDNEQVGSLGKSYPTDNKQITTHNGDIVLYNASNIVVFYGANSWSYTRLGKMDLPEKEVTELLSNGDVTLSLKK